MMLLQIFLNSIGEESRDSTGEDWETRISFEKRGGTIHSVDLFCVSVGEWIPVNMEANSPDVEKLMNKCILRVCEHLDNLEEEVIYDDPNC